MSGTREYMRNLRTFHFGVNLNLLFKEVLKISIMNCKLFNILFFKFSKFAYISKFY